MNSYSGDFCSAISFLEQIVGFDLLVAEGPAFDARLDADQDEPSLGQILLQHLDDLARVVGDLLRRLLALRSLSPNRGLGSLAWLV